MPPGTGDIQLTLCQNSTLSGAIVVTTPHALALADVAKGMLTADLLSFKVFS
jgi:ATP-binding protein involved in chromosome partitioning